MNTDSIRETLQLDTRAAPGRKKYLLVGAALLLAAAAGWYLLGVKGKGVPLYESAPVERMSLTTTVSATGNLEPTNSVDVGIEVSGTIREVFVDYNDRVRAGQVMARLDTTKLQSSVASSQEALARFKANAAEAKASLVYARSEWERVEKMYASTGGNYPSRQEVDNARASMEKAQAAFEAALAQTKQASNDLETSRYNLDKAVVVSPIEGIVLARKVEPGQTVIASMQTPVLFTLAQDLTKMRVILSVDEADIGEVREKQKVEFTVDAFPDRKFQGVITQLRLNSEIVNGVVTYDAVVEVDNRGGLLRPGMTVSAYITTGVRRDVLVVPNAALRFSPSSDPAEERKNAKKKKEGNHVWILKEERPVEVAVKTGKSDGTSTEIIASPLRVGDRVLTGMKQP